MAKTRDFEKCFPRLKKNKAWFKAIFTVTFSLFVLFV